MDHFKWIGVGMARPVKTKSKHIIKENYEAFQCGDLVVAVDDHVLICNGNSEPHESRSIDTCFIGRVEALYDNGWKTRIGDDEVEDRYRAIVTWYSRPQEIPKRHQRPTNDSSKAKFPEVIEDVRLFDNDIDAETIFQKCKVIIVNTELKGITRDTLPSNGLPWFIARWKYDGKSLEPILSNARWPITYESRHRKMPQSQATPSSTTAKRRESTAYKRRTRSNKSEEDAISDTSEEIDLQYSITKALQHGSKVNGECDTETEPALTPSQLQSKQSPFQNFYSPKRLPSSLRVVRHLSFASPTKTVTESNVSSTSPNCTEPSAIEATPPKSAKSSEKVTMEARRTPRMDKNVDGHHQLEKEVNDQKNKVVADNLSLLSNRVRRKLLIDSPEASVGKDLPTKTVRTRSGRVVKTPIRESDSSHHDGGVNAPESSAARKNTPRSNKGKMKKAKDASAKTKSPYILITTRSGRKIKSRIMVDENANEEEDDSDNSNWDGTDMSDDSSEKSCSAAKKRSSLSSNGRPDTASPRTKTPKVTRLHSQRTLTPFIPKREENCSVPNSSLEVLRARLHVSAVPDILPCRENEFANIYSFVEGKIISGSGGCMYISGVPGTGKTATVCEVVRCLKQASESGGIPPFVFIDINGMKLTEPRQAYVQIHEQLTDEKLTPAHASKSLEKRFSNGSVQQDVVLLLVDELDLLWTRNQDVLYNLFDWPNKPHSRLIVLAIANTMDLPERMMKSRIASRVGLTRLTFQPYNFKQLQEIISARLLDTNIFDADAVQLVARKVAALSGDARRALDICRRATEIVGHISSPSKRKSALIGMNEVDMAIQEMFSLPKIEAIRQSSLQEQLFLRAILSEFQRTGLEEATLSRIYRQHVVLCRLEGLTVPNASEVSAIAYRLGNCRLLLVESGSHDMLQRIRLNVGIDDVNYALKKS